MALYQGNILLSGGNNEAPDEIFVAEFNVTTFSEIQSAYNEGKTIFLKHSNALYNMTSYSNSMITFSGFRNNAEFVYRYTVNSSNSWNYEGVPQTPKSHASTHKTGGTDVITPASIGAATLADLEEAVANIPTPDVSGQISAHNADTSAHSDIRSLVSTAQTTANNAASAATAAQTTATNAAAAASASAAEIGDLKITTRTDLGDDWVNPNGDLIDVKKYPGLDALITNTSRGSFSIPNGICYDCKYVNGIFVGIGYSNTKGGTARFISKTKDYLPDGLDVVSINTYYSPSEACAVRYDESTGIWCMAARVNGVSYSWATKDPINGPWTEKIIQSSNTSIEFGDMYCYNGTWVAVGGYYNRTSQYSAEGASYVWVTTDPINGSWTQYDLKSTYGFYNASETHVHCYNGTWVIALTIVPQFVSGSNRNGNQLWIYTTTNPTGTWTGKNISGNSNSSAGPGAGSLYCHDGLWVAVSVEYYRVYTTTNPASTWTQLTNDLDGVNRPTRGSLIWHNDKWYILHDPDSGTGHSTAGIASSTTLDGTWTSEYLNSTDGSSPKCITSGDGMLACVYTSSNNTQYGVYWAKHLPTITFTGANIFMKAK